MEPTHCEPTQTASFTQMVQANALLQKFERIITTFLMEHFKALYPSAPLKICFSVLQDPDTGLGQPMIEVWFPASKNFNISQLNHAFVQKFKEYLMDEAENLNIYQAYRQIQRHFIIIFH